MFNKNAKKLGKKPYWREIYDLRLLNEYVELRPTEIPQVIDVKSHMSEEGYMTIIDVKSCYEGILIDGRDSWFVCTDSPLGRRIHRCLTYGHANGPAICQNIMNEIAAKFGHSLIWVDDNLTKHPSHYTTDFYLHKLILVWC